jgi:hypothetical protein
MCSTADKARTEPSRLTAAEAQFIAACDNFYLASVSETGWPYVQHRGGPPLHLEAFLELRATHNTALYGARDCSGLCAGSGMHRGT